MSVKFVTCCDGRHRTCPTSIEFFQRFAKRVLHCGCSCHKGGEPDA